MNEEDHFANNIASGAHYRIYTGLKAIGKADEVFVYNRTVQQFADEFLIPYEVDVHKGDKLRLRKALLEEHKKKVYSYHTQNYTK